MKNSTFSAQVANNLLTLLQGYSKTIRLLLVMLLTLTVSANVWGATYTKVTSTPADWSGEYIVVYESDNTAYVWTGVDAAKCNTTATISNNSVTGDFVTVTIAPMTGGYSIKVNGGANSGKYICGASGSNKLNFNASAQLNTLSYETDWVKITSNTSVLTFNKASSDMRFRYYKSSSYSSQQHIQLYKLTTGGGVTPDPITVTLDKSTLSLEEGENATLTATVTGSTDAVTWTSDASNIASVDNAGKVTAIAAGTANITAAIGDVKATCKVTVTAATTPDPGTGGETTTVTYVLKDDPNHPANGVDWLSGTIDQYTGWTATKGGSNNPKYYDTGSGLRIYNGGKFTITSSKVMLSITLTFSSDSYTFSADNTTNPQTVTPNATSYEWSVSRTCRLQKIEITYAADGGDDPESEPDPVDPEVTFSNGEYTVGGAALNLSTLLTTNSTGAVTYTVIADGGTGAIIEGSTFTATAAGTCTIQASIAPTATHNAATDTANITVTEPATVEGTWTLVTNATNLKAGDEIVIASNTKGKVAAALTDDYLGEYGVSFSDDKSTITALPATALVFTLGGSTGSWTLTNDGKSLGATAVKKLAWDKGTTTWSISIEEGNATIQNATDTYGRFLHNVQSTRFSTYTSNTSVSMLLPQIYKKGGSTPAPTKLGTPTNLNVAVTTTTATLSWDVVTNANGYIVTVGSTNYEVNTNSITIDNLTSGTTYTWSVTAKGNGSTYADSDAAKGSDFTTKTTTYTITISNDIQNGTIVADKSSAAEGETVKLTVTPEAGYKLDAITVTKATGGIVEVENKTFTMPASNVTVSATFTEIPKYTVSFSTGTGNSTQADISETVGGAGITLPDGPTPNCSGEGWEFFVWSTNNVQDLMTTAPSSLLYAGHTYKPQTNNTTLYAVYSKTESDGSGGTTATVTLTNDEIDAAYVGNGDNKTTSYGNHTIVSASGTWGGRIIIGNESSIKYVGISANDDNRHLASPIFSANITNITIRGRHNASKTRNIYICSSDEEAQPTTGDLGVGSIASSGVQNQFTDWTDVSITVSGNHTQFYVYADGGLQIHSIVVTTGGSTTTTYYHSNPCDDSEPITPTWGKVTINHSSIQVVCGSKTLLNAADPNGPATISFSGTDLVNPVTVTASDGFLVSTNKTVEHTYQSEITINPHKEGQNIGKLQNVYVIAQASAQSGDFTGTITLTGADITGGPQVINVTADVTCTTYTITWSVDGDTELIAPTTFYAGGDWTLPENPIYECNGREFVGWIASEILQPQDYAPNPLYKVKADFPTIESNTTFYAVFAKEDTGNGTGNSGNTKTVTLPRPTKTSSYAEGSIEDSEENTWTYFAAINNASGTFEFGLNANDNNYHIASPEFGGIVTSVSFKARNGSSSENRKFLFCSSNSTAKPSTGDLAEVTIPKSEQFVNIYTVDLSASKVSQFYIYAPKALGITDIAVTYFTESNTSSTTYTSYTTSCADIKGIRIEGPTTTTFNEGDEFFFDGKVYAINNDDSETDVTNSPNLRFVYDMHKTGTQTVTVNYLGKSATYEITIKAVDKWNITWYVNGATNTGLSPSTVVQGQPIGTLPKPTIPKVCEGKHFMGWSTTRNIASDGSDFEPIQAGIIPEDNTTYYAVFAEQQNNGGALGDQLFSESFDTNEGTGGNDDQWNNITTSPEMVKDGWEFTKGYVASQCIRLGTASIAGSATTPALGIDGTATLSFNAGAWVGNEEQVLINLVLVGEGTITPNYITLNKGQFDTYTATINGANDDTKVQFVAQNASKNRFFLDEVYVHSGSNVTYDNYSTSCGDFLVTYYGFTGGYSTTCDKNPGEILVPQFSPYTIPDCTPTEDPKGLGRTFAGTWIDDSGKSYTPGESFEVTKNTTLYAQWTWNTNTIPTDESGIADLATTDVVVTGGNTLTLAEGTTTINSLTLKGGIQADGSYKMPIINIPDNATLKRKSDIIYLDLVVNAKNYYPFAVPFRAKNGSDKANWDYVGYIDPDLKDAATYRTHFVIKTYDGAKRAENGENRDANWVIVNRDTYLEPGIGYMITAMTAGKNTVTMRIPMRVSDDWFAGGEQTTLNEVTRNKVTVTAHTGTATDINNGGHQRHAGWNFVANPYLANFAGSEASNEDGSFITGELLINKGEYYYDRDDDVPYVTIPTYNFEHYYQVKLSEATLSPAYSFFVQVGTDGTMTFGRQQAPASIAARNAEERPVKMDVDITLSDNHSSDQTGIIISDRYSEAYEIGRDLEKLFGSAYNLSVYTLMADNTPLAFQALAIRSSMQVIPVGYRAPEQGEYTFRLNEATSSIDLLNEQYEQLVLVDYQTGELTNLLISDYTFYSERVQSDSRFALYAVPRQNAPTDLPNAIGQDKQAQKIIHNGHLYILRDGNVYNGNGQIVK